jgi:DNA-binding transcriptional LysR family regulator
LSAAARDLGVSTAVVSRRLAALEARLGVRLVNRTTRRLALTDEGASYHDACTRILGEIEDADAAAAAQRVEPQGILKVALPASFGHKHIAPLIPPFAARFPKIQLALSLSDRTVNVIEEGYDLAIRIGELEDSSLAARKLAPNRRVVCASPGYLKTHDAPRTPDDLVRHNCLTTTDLRMNWEYKGPDGKRGMVRVSGITPATTGRCCANGRWPGWASRSNPPGTCGSNWRTVHWSRCCPVRFRHRRGDLRDLSAPPLLAGENACIHRLPRRILRSGTLLGSTAFGRQIQGESGATQAARNGLKEYARSPLRGD